MGYFGVWMGCKVCFHSLIVVSSLFVEDNDEKSVFGEIVSAFFGIALFVIGVLLAVWATERLLEGLVGLSVALRLSAFAVGAVLSGFEVENVAVGLAAGARGTASVALGTVFGGATFLVCVALG